MGGQFEKMTHVLISYENVYITLLFVFLQNFSCNDIIACLRLHQEQLVQSEGMKSCREMSFKTATPIPENISLR